MKCKKCGEKLVVNSLHICDNLEFKTKAGEPTNEEQAKIFKDDIQQPYTAEGKINNQFIKIYGKDKHPKFNKEIKV